MDKLIKKEDSSPYVQLSLIPESYVSVSDYYSAIPKTVTKALESEIRWDSENLLAHPLVIPFQLGEKLPVHTSVISPASILQKDGSGKSMFPKFREDQIESAIISLLAKEKHTGNVQIQYDKNKNVKYVITLSPYQIQKEICDAIYKREGRVVQVKNCRYSAENIREALKILSGANNTILNEDGQKEYDFRRIKELGIDDESGRFVIEVSSFVTNSINKGDYFSYAFQGLLAPSDEVEATLVKYLYRKYNWAGRDKVTKKKNRLSIYATTLMANSGYTGKGKSMSDVISKFVKKIENIAELEKIIVGDSVKDGRKVIDKKLHLIPSDYFITSTIQANEVTQGVDQHIITTQGEALPKPMPHQYPNKPAYEKALKEYGIEKARVVLDNH